MEFKKVIKLINETINSTDFDFLGMSNIEDEQQIVETLNNYVFQKKFLYDLLFNKNNITINASEVTLKKELDSDLKSGKLNFEYSANIEYTFDEIDLEFEILFTGESIDFKITESEYDGTEKLIIDWDSINYEVYSNNGDLIDFHVFEKMEDPRIERMFLREFLGYFIEKEVRD